MPTTSISCPWARSPSHWRQCCCRKCRRDWQRAMSRGHRARRTMRRRCLLRIDAHLTRALPAILLAAMATGAAALGGVALGAQAQLGKELLLACAVIAGGLAYGAVTLVFRSRLPLGKFAR